MLAQFVRSNALRFACLPLVLMAGLALPGYGQTTAAAFGEVIRLGMTPSDIVLDESRGRLYLVNQNANRVEIWDYISKTRAGSISTGRGPLAAAMSMDSGYLYVTNAGTTATPDATLTVISLANNSVLATVPLPARPQGVEVGSDGRVLISTLGTGTNNAANTLLIYDRMQSSQQVFAVPVPPAPTSPAQLGTTFLSRPQTAFAGKLIRTPDGNFIIGINPINNGASTLGFVYEVASGTILKSRTIAGQSTVFSMSPDGSRFMAGSTQFNTLTLAVTAQASTANAPFPMPAGFNNNVNLGGSIFSPDGLTLYSAFNVAATTVPAPRPSSSILLVSDAQNLQIRLGIRMPESLVARVVMTADGTEAWGASESGIMYLPLGKLYEYPILQPETTQVFLAVDDCNRGIATAKLKINNLGSGKLTFAVPVTSNTIVVRAESGMAPSYLNFTMEPGRTGIARQPGTNLSFNGGLGGTPVSLDLISPEAINIPPRIRIYMNYRTNDMRGVIKPIPTILDNNFGLRDLVLDENRGKLYVANAGFNRLEVYNVKTQQLEAPIPVCQLPQQMALSTDGYTMYVGCQGSEGVGIVDLDIGRYVGEVEFPPVPRQGNAGLIWPRSLAMGLSGLQIVMSDGRLWKVVGNQAIPRDPSPVTGIQANGAQQAIAGQARMIAGPDYGQILLLNGNGTGYLYDALIDNYTTSRQLFTIPIQGMYYGPMAISSENRFMLANGLVLNNSLTPIGGAERPGQAVTTPPTGPGQPPVTTIVSAGQRHVSAVAPLDQDFFIRMTLPVRQNLNPATTRDEARTTLELVDIRTGAEQLVGVIPENPPFTLTGTGVLQVPPRWMVTNSARTTAFALTLSGLSIINLSPSTSASKPTIPLGVRGMVNSNDGTQNIRPGSFVTVTGTNLAESAAAAQVPLPTVLGGSCVVLNDLPLPMIRTSPTQIAAQVPEDLRPGLYVMQVRSLAVAQASDPIVINVQRAQ
jgi:DNA-binding beta-propeller fold protein YncE